MIDWFAVMFGIILFAVGLYGLSNKDWKWEHRWVAVSFFIFSFYMFSQVHTEEFNSTLHECTEWECTLGDFLIQDNQNGNWHCSFYDEGIYDTGLRVSHITGEKEPISECVSFREKTECEKGNPEYKVVRGEGYFTYATINEFGGEKNFIRNYNKRHPSKIIKTWHIDEYRMGAEFCTKKSVEELEADYCRDAKQMQNKQRCYCTNTTSQPFNISGNIIYYDICVSAVPVSEKLYCNENPASDKCECVEYGEEKRKISVYNVTIRDYCYFSHNDTVFLERSFNTSYYDGVYDAHYDVYIERDRKNDYYERVMEVNQRVMSLLGDGYNQRCREGVNEGINCFMYDWQVSNGIILRNAAVCTTNEDLLSRRQLHYVNVSEKVCVGAVPKVAK